MTTPYPQQSRPQTGRTLAAALMGLFTFMAVVSTPPASGQFYWDTNGAAPGSGNAGGTWNDGNVWSLDPAGGAATQAWIDGNRAIFSAGSDGVGLREIGVIGTVNPNGILVKDGVASFTSGIINSAAVVQANNNATLRINGASVTASLFEAGRGSFGTIDMVSGGLTANAIDVGNPASVGGAVVQSGGTVSLDGVGRPGNVGLRLGHWPSAVPSTYGMTGGTLNVTASGGMHVGWDGPGQFTMNGASAAINTTQLRVGSPIATGGSTLNLQDGTITARFVDLGVRGVDRPGTINQTGGSLIVQSDGGGGTPELRIGHWPGATSGTYNLTGGSLDTTGAITRVGWDGRGELNIGGNASFDAGNINVMQGSLVAIGGSATVGANNLKLVQGGVITIGSTSTTSFNDIALGGAVDGRSGTGTLNLNGGALQTGRLSVGDSVGGHAGFVNQTGGDFAVGGQFLLGHWGNNTSIYNMSGGSLTLTGIPAGGGEQVGGIYIGIDGSGIFNHSGGTVTTNFVWLDNRGQTAGPHEYNLTGGELVLTSGIGIGSSNPGNPGLQVNLGGGTITANTNTAINVAATLTGSGGDVSFDTNGNTLTVSSVLSGPGGLSKTGGGTMILSAANTFEGQLVVDSGLMQVTNTLRNVASIQVNSGATLELGATNMFVPNHGTALADSRTITVDGGAVVMTAAMDSRIGNVNLQNGATWTSNRGLGAWDVLLANTTSGPATVHVSGSGASVMNGTGGIHLQGLQNFHVENVTGDSNPDLLVSMILAGPGNSGGAVGGIVKTGDGTMRMTAVNSYTGGTIVDGGVLDLARPGNSGDGTVRGTLSINPGATVITSTTNSLGWGGATRVTQLNINGGLLDNTATGDQGWGIAINLTGGTLQSNGGLSATGAPSYFSLGGGSSINSLASADTSTIAGRINLREGNPGNQLTFNVGDGSAGIDLEVSAAITQQNGSHGITKTGDGTMRMTGDTTYTGPTNVQAGTLLMSGNHSASTGNVTVQSGATLGGTGIIGGTTLINDGAVLAPGNSAGTLTFNQNLTLAPGATFSADVLFGGTTTDLVVMNQNTVLALDGAVLAGTWDGSDSNLFRGTYSSDTMFWIVDNQGGSQIDGTFANSTPAPGFAGLFDGVTPHLVTIDDQLFAAFYQSEFGTFSQAGLTGGNDLLLMAIPEPSRALLLTIAAATLLLRRRR